MVKLLYKDHVKAHQLLFIAYNNRTYQRPLSWMLNEFEYKTPENLSKAAKKAWNTLKNNPIAYEKWQENRSNVMKQLSSEEQTRRCKIFWDNITPERHAMFCQTMKNAWTPEAREAQSNKLKRFYEDPNNRIKKSAEVKAWKEMQSDEDKIAFKKKMSDLNKDKTKRDKAGIAIKAKWQDPLFRDKMLNRKSRPGTNVLITFTDGTHATSSSINKLVNLYDISVNVIRKYINTGLRVTLKNNPNSPLNGAIIQKID
jgi:hypothetical protein